MSLASRKYDQSHLSKLVGVFLAVSLVCRAEAGTCPPRTLGQELGLAILAPKCKANAPVVESFPTKNFLMDASIVKWARVPVKNSTSQQGKELEGPENASDSNGRSEGTVEENAKSKSDSGNNVISNLVYYFYAPRCPYSAALRPVMECVPRYFPASKIAFIAQDNTGPPTPNFRGGVTFTPMVKTMDQNEYVDVYDGPRTLSDMVHFVQKTLGIEAVIQPLPSHSCQDHQECRCDFEAREVTKHEIIDSTSSLYMCGAIVFLAAVSWRIFISKEDLE